MDFIIKLTEHIKFDQNINIPLINEINFVDKRNKYNKSINSIPSINFDDVIIADYNDSISNILNKNKDLSKFINVNFYGNKLISDFISSRIVRNIINNLFYKAEYSFNKREIVIYSKSDINDNLINKIDSILNFFDYITKKSNYYKIDIYLSDEKKKINFSNTFLGSDNINSGLTLPKYYIVLFREEELIKVLFHELIHYLDLDMRNYQNELLFLYKDINLTANMINPNEAYTETLALILMNIWEYQYRKININDFINYKIDIEFFWSLIQITKILKFFNYKSLNSLFTKKSAFIQKTNVLSYFFLKTIFLMNINLIFQDLHLHNLYINRKRINTIKNNSNLRQLETFIDKVYPLYDKNNFDKTTLRMTFYG